MDSMKDMYHISMQRMVYKGLFLSNSTIQVVFSVVLWYWCAFDNVYLIRSIIWILMWFFYCRDVCLLQQELKEKEKADTELGKETNRIRDEV